MSKRVLTILLVFVSLSVLLGASFRKEDIKVERLDNGLKILLLEEHNIPNVALYTFFRVGSRNERTGLTGVSHFIEHMMFNGTAKFGPGDFDRRMEFKGGSNNAYTSEDMTAYTDWLPSAALETMIEMEADRIQGLAFVPEVLESERGVVASERRLGIENDNDGLLGENVRAMAIMAHPYHWDVIGWMSDIQSWRRDDIMAYYRTFYAPNNAVLILVGDFESAQALSLIKKYYSSIPAGPAPPAVTTVEPPQLGVKQVTLRKEAQTPSFQMVFHSPAAKDTDFPPLSILGKILLSGESSRLYRRLVRQEQLAISVGGGVDETIDPYLFFIVVKPRQSADLSRLENVIGEELAKVRNELVGKAEYQKALNITRSEFYSGLQTIAGKANQLGFAEIIYDDYGKLFTLMDRYSAVKRDELREAARKYLTDKNKTVGRLVPEGGAQ